MGWNTKGFIPDDFNTVIHKYYDAFVSMPGYESVSFSRFEASKEYETFYSSAQVDIGMQAAFSVTFEMLKAYIQSINFEISRPATVPTKIIESIKDQFGYVASVKKMTLADAGKMHIAIDYDDTGENVEIAKLLSEVIVGGIVTDGNITQSTPIGDGISFDYKWTKMAHKTIKFRISIKKSKNSRFDADKPGDIVAKFLSNWDEEYTAGLDIEPETYFEIGRDAPYASRVLTEYSLDDGGTWSNDSFETVFSDLYIPTIGEGDITIT